MTKSEKTEIKAPLYRAKPGSLAISEPTPFCRKFAHRAECTVEDMLHPLYFAAESGGIEAGDSIRVVCIRGGRVREMAEIVIVEINGRELETKLIGDVISFDAPEKKPGKPDEPKGPEFVSDAGTVTGDDENGYVVKVKGKVVAKVGDKQLAENIAHGNEPIPVK